MQKRQAERDGEAARKAAERIAQLTVRVLIDRWDQEALRDRRPRYRTEAVRALLVNFAELLDRPAQSMDRAAAKGALDVIAKRRGKIMGRRSLAYARAMFGWAKRHDLVVDNPFAGVRIEGKEPSRDRVLTDAELGEVWRAAGKLGWPYGDYFRFLLLTLQREAEAAGLRWAELSDDLAVWELPRARTKNGKAHLVHLSDPARAILQGARRVGNSSFVFTTTGKRPINSFSNPKVRLDKEIAKERARIAAELGTPVAPLVPWRLHLRRTGVTALARLGVRWEVADKLLNHQHGGAISVIAGIYQKHEFLDEREKALTLWTRHVLAVSGEDSASNVIELRRA